MLSLLSRSTVALAPNAGSSIWSPEIKNWIPFGKGPFPARPPYLDGTYSADVGFDPLGLVEREGWWWKVAGARTPARRVAWMREAEVKHARLAMLAAAGWPLSELWHGPLTQLTGLPFELDATFGRAPSVLNGNLGEAWPVLLFTLVFSSFLELKTLDQVYGLTALGKTINKQGIVVEKSYVPGDLNFDPLNLYGAFGFQPPPMIEAQIRVDDEYRMAWARYARYEMEGAEIRNGRLAMLAITGFAIQEFVYGTPVVDQTPILFTPIWELLFSGKY